MFRNLAPCHATLAAFEKGLQESDPEISPSQVYAYAALKLSIPYANGAPNLTVDTPALMELAKQNNVPIGGKDFKTGQTLMKTILAPGFKARPSRRRGVVLDHILGNRDGEVLDDPESFKSRRSRSWVRWSTSSSRTCTPTSTATCATWCAINYYPPARRQQRGLGQHRHLRDIFGWMGYQMQIKIDFLCRDSILAAPIVLDLALFMDLAQRCGMGGIQEWLSFYWKSPQSAPGLYPEHDLFIQLMKLKNTLRHLRGEDLITHLGAEYYD